MFLHSRNIIQVITRRVYITKPTQQVLHVLPVQESIRAPKKDQQQNEDCPNMLDHHVEIGGLYKDHVATDNVTIERH